MAISTAVTNIIKHFELKHITKVEDLDLWHDSVLRTKEPIRVKFMPRFLTHELDDL